MLAWNVVTVSMKRSPSPLLVLLFLSALLQDLFSREKDKKKQKQKTDWKVCTLDLLHVIELIQQLHPTLCSFERVPAFVFDWPCVTLLLERERDMQISTSMRFTEVTILIWCAKIIIVSNFGSWNISGKYHWRINHICIYMYIFNVTRPINEKIPPGVSKKMLRIA